MELEIWQLLRLARRWWWLLVLGPLVGAAAAFVVSAREQPEYTATSYLRINPAQISGVIDFDDLYNGDTLAATYRLLVWTPSVLSPVIDDLGLDESIETVGNRVSAWPVEGTQLLRLSVVDPEPIAAAELANAVALSLASHIAEDNATLNQTARAALEQQMADAQLLIEETNQQIQTLENSPTATNPSVQAEIRTLQTSLDQHQDLYAGLVATAQSMDLNAAIASQQVTVAAPAEPPTASDASSPMLLTLFGGLAGFLVAAAAVSVLGFLDRTVRAGTDFVGLIGSPQLSVIPNEPKLWAPADQVFMLNEPNSAAAEAVRLLRINLELASAASEVKLLAITSPGPNEGKSTVAANLAVALAQTGVSTVLIDADLRNPTLHTVFGVPNERGLATNLMNPEAPWDAAAVQTSVPGLTLLPSGPVPPSPADLLSRDRFPALLQEIERSARMVILDTPAMQAGTDALVIAPHVDGIVLVGRSGQTRLDAMQWAAGALRPAEARIVGVVLNRESGRNVDFAGYAATTAPAPARDEVPPVLTPEPEVNRRKAGTEPRQAPGQEAVIPRR